MTFDPIPVLVLFAGVGVLVVLPGGWYARRMLPDLTRLEATALGYAIGVSALVVAVAVLDLVLEVTLDLGAVAALYVAYAAVPASRGLRRVSAGLWGWNDLAGPRARPRRTAGLLGLGAVVLALAALWAGHSNIVRSYPWPHHADGYIHWGNARAMMDHGGLPYGNWLTGGGAQGPTDETGFWYLLAGLAWIVPLSLPQVAVHGKLLFVAALAVAAWGYGSRDATPFGLEAALLVPLIPTTHRFLGPMFLVPMTVVLSLALAAGIAARSERRLRALPLVLLLGAGGLLVHSATAGVVALVAGWRLLLSFRTRREIAYAAGAAAAFAAGFLAIVMTVPHLERYWNRMIQAWMEPQTVTHLGLSMGGGRYLVHHLTRWPLLLFGLGSVAAFRGRHRRDAQALVLSLPPILAIMVAYERWTRGFSSLYDRTFFFTGFLYLMIAAVGLAEARRGAVWAGRRVRRRLRRRLRQDPIERARRALRQQTARASTGLDDLPRAVGPALLLVLAAAGGGLLTGAGTAFVYTQVHPVKKSTFYNTYPENETFQRFLEIRENLEDLQGADLALLDPAHANEFAAITGLHIWSHTIHPEVRPNEVAEIHTFLGNDCGPLDYLNRTGAEMVVGAECSSSGNHFEKVLDQVYLYRPALD